MKQDWSKNWLSSKKPSKQRKYRYNAPLHIRHKMLAAHLNKELRAQHKRRSFPVRKGDKVKIMRGDYKGTIGEVQLVDMKNLKIHVKGAEEKTKAGPVRFYPIEPSNVLLISVDLADKKRAEALGKNKLIMAQSSALRTLPRKEVQPRRATESIKNV
ncbi:MAG: 50S ribosomal protein L24 [DPANN group archaeon]|nr:50S ribosomal protein L24 [DPANN group archaeon]